LIEEVGKLRKNMRFVRDCDEMRMEYRWRDGGMGGQMDGGVLEGGRSGS